MTLIYFLLNQKRLLGFLVVISFPFFSFSQNAEGYVIENIDTTLIQKKIFSSNGNQLPTKYDLLKLVPKTGNQKNIGSCVSWAASYYALTIVKRIEGEIGFNETYSPLCLHNRLKAAENESPCVGGNCILPALNLLKESGCEKFDSSKNKCSFEPASNKHETGKLFAFDPLDISVNQLKYALKENYPIVIGVNSFKNGWENDLNFENGVWNGKHGSMNFFDGHAMCIIGFNDSIANGAFLVKNSWGNNWGKNGEFWLKYENINIIKYAYCLRPKEKIPTTNDDTNKEKIGQAKYFRVYNKTPYNCYLAVTMKITGKWLSKGWFCVPKGGFYDFNIGDREENDIYWIASAEKNKIIWSDESKEGKSFGYEPQKKFELLDYSYAQNKINYFKVSPGKNDEFVSTKLTTKEVVTRGNETIVLTENARLNIDTKDAKKANKNWKKKFVLFDLYSNDIINSNLNENGIPTLNIWYKETSTNKIINKIFTEQDLENLNEYKFSNKENLEHWFEYEQTQL
jgi:hypothetical protein